MEILCETSVRHVHLSRADIETLFGKGTKLTKDRQLSQPGEYLCKERVTLVGPKETIANVAIVGPARDKTQVEISRTDAFKLGLKGVPVRLSGDLEGTPTLSILTFGTNGEPKSVGEASTIIAKRHVHLDPKTAKESNLENGQIVKIKFDGERACILEEVVVRVNKEYAPAIHIDSDEGNATLSGRTAFVIR
ncbi:MAG: phosphate propanoyltransferase [Firmicutes bacterium]|nr:phosphate propanoyltransferase [Bacillota bacterium]